MKSFSGDEEGIEACAKFLAGRSVKPENKFKSIDEMKRSMWRRYFLGPCLDLNNMSPMEAAKTPEGRVLLEAHLKVRERFEAAENVNDDGDDELHGFNPPSEYIKWKIGLSNITDGESKFKAEEEFYNGEDSPATLASLNAGKHVEGGKNICNFCVKEGKKGTKLLVCSRCKSRRYCSKECQKRDWKVSYGVATCG